MWEGLEVDAGQMRANIDITHGLVMSRAVILMGLQGLHPAAVRATSSTTSATEAIKVKRPLVDLPRRTPDRQASAARGTSSGCTTRPTTSDGRASWSTECSRRRNHEPRRSRACSSRIPCVLMRRHVQGAVLPARRLLPVDPVGNDHVLLSLMGSPHARQVDGIGGRDNLTSKVVIVGRSRASGIDVSDTCSRRWPSAPRGHHAELRQRMLAGVSTFVSSAASSRRATGNRRPRLQPQHAQRRSSAWSRHREERVTYEGDVRIDGVPRDRHPSSNFLDARPARDGRLLPYRECRRPFDGLEISCVDRPTLCIVIRRCRVFRQTAPETKGCARRPPHVPPRALERVRRQATRCAWGWATSPAKVPSSPSSRRPPPGDGRVALFRALDCHLCGDGRRCASARCCIPGSIAHRHARRATRTLR